MMSRTGNKAFTLVEVMVAVAVLALGTVLVQESFLLSIDAYARSLHYLEVSSLLNGKVWDAQDQIMRLGDAAKIPGQGSFIEAGKEFSWDLNHQCLEERSGLYRIDLMFSWVEGSKNVRLSRVAYAIHKKNILP